MFFRHLSLNATLQLLQMQSFPLALRPMALTFELSEPTALAASCSLIDSSIKSGPKLALTVHKVSAIGLYASGTATDRYINRQNEYSAEIRPARLRRARRISAGFLRMTQCSSQLCLRRIKSAGRLFWWRSAKNVYGFPF